MARSQKVIHDHKPWIQFFLNHDRAGLDSLVVNGWIQSDGKKYYTILIDSAFYSGAEWHFLNLDTPLRGGGSLWAFSGEKAVEPFLFYASEFEIKYTLGVKSWTLEPYDNPFSNLGNTDLYTFFNNSKVHKSKKDREEKLKDKKDISK